LSVPLFSYRAYDRKGNERAGALEASDLGEARGKLRVENLTPFELTENPGFADRERTLFSSFSLGEAARFSRQMAALLKGGVPLSQAISGLEKQEAWASRRELFLSLRECIEKGGELSAVLQDHGGIFQPSALSIIKVGEATGRLYQAFWELSQHLTRLKAQQRRLIAALAYPAVTGVVAIGVLTFLMVYLIPVISKLFSEMQGKLPLITRLLIAMSGLLQNYGLVLVLCLLGLWVLFRKALSISRFRRGVEETLLWLPFIGSFLQGILMEAWARNIGMMVRCGVALLDAIRVHRTNSPFILESEALERVEHGLERGESLATAMRKSSGFSVFLIQMIEAGEASGELPGMLEAAAGELEADNQTRTELVLNVIEPLLVVAMGIVVGGIMIGVLLPIYEMNRLL